MPSPLAAYPMRVYRDEESGDWVAEVVDLPGCIGVGDSLKPGGLVLVAYDLHWVTPPSRADRALDSPIGVPPRFLAA